MQWSKEETKINVRPLNRGHEYGDDGDEGDMVLLFIMEIMVGSRERD